MGFIHCIALETEKHVDTILATWGLGVMLQQIVRLTAGGELRYVEMPPSLAATSSCLMQDRSLSARTTSNRSPAA